MCMCVVCVCACVCMCVCMCVHVHVCMLVDFGNITTIKAGVISIMATESANNKLSSNAKRSSFINSSNDDTTDHDCCMRTSAGQY